MNEVLMSDEDMALMYLTAGEQSGGAARDPRQHQEVEMLFENYLFQVIRAIPPALLWGPFQHPPHNALERVCMLTTVSVLCFFFLVFRVVVCILCVCVRM